MATLAERDTSMTFGLREGELREITNLRTRHAKVFELPPAPDGRRRYRVGAGIGPVHYPSDVWADAPDWHEIDLEIRETSKGLWTMKAAGYSARFWQQTERQKPLNYIGEFSRGGATYRMAPLSLSWQDADGKEERIAKTTAGIDPRIDPDAYTITWEDAFGAGLSYGYNLQPDKLFKVLSITDRESLPQPKRIKPTRLVLRLWVSWDGDGIPDGDLPSVAGDYAEVKAEPTTLRPVGPYAHRHIERDLPCFWVQSPEAWDTGDGETQQRWALDWWYERRGHEVTLCLALDATALAAATYPVLMDTAITEEVVGASSDDAYDNGTTCTTNSAQLQICYGTNAHTTGLRFTTVPIPTGAEINSATVSMSAYVYDDPDLVIYCEDADNPATFSSASFPKDRPKTTASVSWDATNIGGGWKNSPDISVPVGEQVARAGWASGNSVAVILTSDRTSGRNFWVNSMENGYAPKFNCAYTASVVYKDAEISDELAVSGSSSGSVAVTTVVGIVLIVGGSSLGSVYASVLCASDYVSSGSSSGVVIVPADVTTEVLSAGSGSGEVAACASYVGNAVVSGSINDLYVFIVVSIVVTDNITADGHSSGITSSSACLVILISVSGGSSGTVIIPADIAESVISGGAGYGNIICPTTMVGGISIAGASFGSIGISASLLDSLIGSGYSIGGIIASLAVFGEVLVNGSSSGSITRYFAVVPYSVLISGNYMKGGF